MLTVIEWVGYAVEFVILVCVLYWCWFGGTLSFDSKVQGVHTSLTINGIRSVIHKYRGKDTE